MDSACSIDDESEILKTTTTHSERYEIYRIETRQFIQLAPKRFILFNFLCYIAKCMNMPTCYKYPGFKHTSAK